MKLIIMFLFFIFSSFCINQICMAMQTSQISDEKCTSPEELKKIIISESPGLQDALDNKKILDAAWILCRWSAENFDWFKGGNNSPINRIDWRLPVGCVYDLSKQNINGGYCSACAVFYHNILNIFNIDSFIIDIGFNYNNSNKFTHVTTIIPIIKSNGDINFYLFDPTFLSTFKKNNFFSNLKDVIKDYINNGMSLTDNMIWNEYFKRDYLLFNNSGVSSAFKTDEFYMPNWLHKERKNYKIGDTYLFDKYITDSSKNLILDALLSNVNAYAFASQKNKEEFSKLLTK